MLTLRPIDYETAARYVDTYHRHHRRPVGHKYSIAVYDGDRLCGVAMVGRPVSRYFDDNLTLEINRVCTDGTKNPALSSMALLGGRQRRLGISALSLTRWKARTGQACEPQISTVTEELEVKTGLASAIAKKN